MLGSLSEADDAVQESWLHLSRSDTCDVKNLGGWLTTVVACIYLDMLRSRKTLREESLEVPVPITSHHGGINPEQEALLADSVGLALLVVLDTLTPAERLAFVLHDIFAVPFDEIAPVVEHSETAARQLASRARRRVRGRAFPVTKSVGEPSYPSQRISAQSSCCRRFSPGVRNSAQSCPCNPSGSLVVYAAGRSNQAL